MRRADLSGDGEMTGDDVVPLDWALLDGSRTIVLDGVVHSINEAGTSVPTDRWYGAEDIVDCWLVDALEETGMGAKVTQDDSPLSQMFASFIGGK